MNNCFANYGSTNARELADMLGREIDTSGVEIGEARGAEA